MLKTLDQELMIWSFGTNWLQHHALGRIHRVQAVLQVQLSRLSVNRGTVREWGVAAQYRPMRELRRDCSDSLSADGARVSLRG